MGWSPVERLIEVFRDRLAAEPAAVRAEIEVLLRGDATLRPSDRLRLLGLVVSAGKKLGDWGAADRAALEGLAIGTSSAVARADFLLQVAILRIVQHRAEEALKACNQAGDLMTSELTKPAPKSKEGQRRRQWMLATNAAAHVVRGELFLHLGAGSANGALADALAAVEQMNDLVRATSHARRVHLSGITLLCALLVRVRAPEMASEVLQLIDRAERQLIYRCRLPPEHLHRVKLRWCRALALARLGQLGRAERLLVEVVERLLASGLRDDAQRALDALVGVMNQAKRVGRAEYYRLKYGR